MGVLRSLSRLAKLWAAVALLQTLLKLSRHLRERSRIWAIAKGQPTVAGHWFWGGFLKYISNIYRIHDYRLETFAQMSEAEGKTLLTIQRFPAAFGSKMQACTRDPVVVKHILSDNFQNYVKTEPCRQRFVLDLFDDFLGEGIFAIDHGEHAKDGGKSWKLQRKVSSTIFTGRQFKGFMTQVFREHTDQLNDRLREAASSGSAATDLQSLFFKFTMDSIGKIGFGVEFGTLKGEENIFATSFDGAHHAMMLHTKTKALSLLSSGLPWPLDSLASEAIRRASASSREFDAHLKHLNKYSYAMIARRHAELDAAEAAPAPRCGGGGDGSISGEGGDGERNRSRSASAAPPFSDLLSLFMAWRDKESGEGLSDRLLRDLVISFIIAGRDTTACLLTWTFWMLFQPDADPAVLRRLRDEIEAAFGRGGSDEDAPKVTITHGALSKEQCPVLHGVIYEALRLHPPVPMDRKVAVNDDLLPGGFKIAAGTGIEFLPFSMGRLPHLWPEPEKVKPERWYELDSEGQVSGTTSSDSGDMQYTFPVFQAGPRACIGRHMALFEAKMVLVSVLREGYSFEFTAPDKVTYSPMLTMSVASKLPCKVSCR